MSVRATPFHMRAAEANGDNAWVARNEVTLAARYGDAASEALAARFSVAMADISWRWRVRLEGTRSEAFLSRLMTRNPASLATGQSLKALWLNDAGAVRGAGVAARLARNSFLLASAAEDRAWIASAAALFGVSLDESAGDAGGLALIGPYAPHVLVAAGIGADLEPLAFRRIAWSGIDITLTRWGEHGGYEIWCEAEDALIVWDRIVRAGRSFALMPAGSDAMDILDIEAGVARPWRDYIPARAGASPNPSPGELGLTPLIDDGHLDFNGRSGLHSLRCSRALVGVALESDTPAPHTPLFQNGRIVGRTLSSVWSPALRRAISLAQIECTCVTPGTALSLSLPLTLGTDTQRQADAAVTDLPFLAAPGSISP